MKIFENIKKIYNKLTESYITRTNVVTQELIDDQLNKWVQLRGESSNQFFLEFQQNELRDMSRFLARYNCHYCGLIRTYKKFIAGKKVEITSKNNNEKYEKNWQEWAKNNKWNFFFQEIIRKFFIDGEVFIYVPSWKILKPEKIVGNNNTEGIEISSEGNVLYYYYQNDDNEIIIEEKDIIHIKEEKDLVRGIPYFFSTMTKVQDYDSWLQNRILLNKIRASIALIRKHNASSDDIKTFADAKKTTTYQNAYNETIRKKTFQAGTIIDTNAKTEYQFLNPNVNANDVKDDGRSILLAICASVGLPEYLVTADSSNANYASTMVSESPAVREFQFWQCFFEEYIQEIYDRVQKQNDFYYENEDDCIVTFPELITRNRKEEAEVNQILLQNNVISIEEWRRRENVDIDQMQKEIDSNLNDEMVAYDNFKKKEEEENLDKDKEKEDKKEDKKNDTREK